MSQFVYEKDNFWWQIGKAQQMLSEWWEKKNYGFKDTLRSWSLPSWLFDFLWEIAKVLCWVLIAFLLVWTVWKSSPLFRLYYTDFMTRLKPLDSVPKNKNICEISTADWLQKAQKFQASGNYTEAIFCLYSATIQKLHDTGIAANLSSRTDGEYLKIIDRLMRSPSYQTLFNVHQDLCFSGTKADLNLWQRCDRAYQELERDS